jgi:hypothetical protein
MFFVYDTFNGDLYGKSRTRQGAERLLKRVSRRLNSNPSCGDLASYLRIDITGTEIIPQNFRKASFNLG